MRRREFLIGGAAAAWPVGVRAQQPSMPVIGYLGSETPELFASRLDAFRQGLASVGFVEGKSVVIQYRWAQGRNDRLPELAAELVRANVNVLSTPGSLASAFAAKGATSTIPVVFETGAEPVAAGLVASLNKPGGNLTGITSLNAQVGPKRLESLYELLPGASTFVLLVNPTNPRNAEATVAGMERAARSLKLNLPLVQASRESEFDDAFAKVRELRAAGMVIANETFFAMRSDALGVLAQRYAVPAAHQSREFVLAGGLMSYGGDVMESHRQAGVYTGRVLKGEKPVDLPVQQVTKVHMVINFKAAKALGLNVPLAMSARADEVIE
jgi:putative tryptophan/tyrosine transport system substrate-binding protein